MSAVWAAWTSTRTGGGSDDPMVHSGTGRGIVGVGRSVGHVVDHFGFAFCGASCAVAVGGDGGSGRPALTVLDARPRRPGGGGNGAKSKMVFRCCSASES